MSSGTIIPVIGDEVEGRPSESSTNVVEKKDCTVTGQDVVAELVPHRDPIDVASDVMDIVLVRGLSASHSQSVLKLYFTNKRKCGGGDVTNVILNGTQAYISFADSNGLDNVMTKIFSIPLDDNVHIQARRPVVLANNVFENTTTQRCTENRWLERCAANSNNSETDCYRERETFDKEKSVVHSEIDDSIESLPNKTCFPLGEDVDHVTQRKTSPGLSVLASSSEVEPKQEFFTMKVSKPLINCVKKNQKRIQEMLTPLCADISIDMELEQLTVNHCPGLEGWKATCQSAIESYMTSLVSETVSFSSELKTAVLSLIVNCTESHPQADIKFDEENLSVVISGEKLMVDDLKDQLCKLQNVNTDSKGSKVLPFLKSKLNMFHFKSKSRNCSISVSEKVKDEEDFVFVDDYVMSCTTVDISNDIVQFLSTTRGNSLLQSYLKSFETVTFDHSGQLVILCSSKDDGVNAAKKIKEQVVSVCVPFNLPKMLLPLFKSKEWITLRSSLEETHSASIILSSDRLTVIGDKRSLVAVKNQ
ncbi:uncharacterized protein [Dysidea avara]|uniref:uncharacterized protein isoform X2 n=1 Tax=Dysidea avara TaxID=196820 RepID=UPI0033265A6B